MSNIYVNQVNFEHPESGVLHDILVNSGGNIPSLAEQIVTPSFIYVNIVNLEIPVTELAAEVITNTGTATHTLLEAISGTPVVEEQARKGGGELVDDLIFVGSPVFKEILTSVGSSQQEFDEATYVYETALTSAQAESQIDALIRKPIYRKTRELEILPYTFARDGSSILTVNTPSTRRSKKEEEELILLGII